MPCPELAPPESPPTGRPIQRPASAEPPPLTGPPSSEPSPRSLPPNWNWLETWAFRYFGRGPRRRALRTIVMNLWGHHGLELASAMAFDLFLALIPLLALAGWVLSLVLKGDAETMHQLSVLLDLTPTDVQNVVNQHAERFFGSTLAPVAFAGALWLGSGAFATVMAAFQRTVPARERPWWLRRTIAIVCVLVMLAAISVGSWFAVQLGGVPAALLERFPDVLEVSASDYVGFLVTGGALTALVALFFRIGVSRDVPRRVIWPGTLLAVGIGGSASYALSLYVSRLARYAFYYGSLAAVAVLLAWLWICSFALLLGAELNAYLEEKDLPPESRPPRPAALAETET